MYKTIWRLFILCFVRDKFLSENSFQANSFDCNEKKNEKKGLRERGELHVCMT